MTPVSAPLQVLMICAHEPGLDPRIRWEAEAAAGRFSVTVLGFNRDDGSLPDAQSDAGYRVVRRRRNSVSGIYYFWRLKAVVPQALHIPLGALLLLMSPVLIHWSEFGKRLSGFVQSQGQPVSLVSGTYAKESVDPLDAVEAAKSELFPR